MNLIDMDELFTDEERARLALVDAAFTFLRNARRARLSTSDSTNAEVYAQLWLHRIVQLGEGVASEWKARRYLASAILLRSLFEVVSAFHHFVVRGCEQLEADELDDFNLLVDQLMYGSRVPDSDLPKAINALTFLKRLDRDYPGTMQTYESLCELAHPNVDGHVIFGTITEDQTLELGEQPNDRGMQTLARFVASSLEVLEPARRMYICFQDVMLPALRIEDDDGSEEAPN